MGKSYMHIVMNVNRMINKFVHASKNPCFMREYVFITPKYDRCQSIIVGWRVEVFICILLIIYRLL